MKDDPLSHFLPPVQEWFRTTLGTPTPAQTLGWPAIVSGRHTLILAPTGSGKTLAAFLACLDGLWRQDPLPAGVRVLYVSPLKALNNDIHRNLQVPLAGVVETAKRMGLPLPELTSAVRTGDTPSAERQRFLRHPPHILITTPESLHLLLTSRAREAFRHVTHCIVDEIHALCPNKRGVFLSLLLERLEAITPRSFVRIGLSATQRPLEGVARFLAGAREDESGHLVPRPVTVIDAGLRKDLDLCVVCPVDAFGPLPEKSVWPSIYRLLAKLIETQHSTIVFANNRRTVERISSNLNEAWHSERQAKRAENDQEHPITDPSSLIHSSPSAFDLMARAHHGSVALEVRRQTEQALKEGRVSAVVATASLELGIDMGTVDLVCQVESPGSIARALQRVGRAGHLVGQKSKGRLIPKMPSDLLEQAALAREMAAGRVEELHVPSNCLDVLAQQLVALASMDPWEVPELFRLVRRAYPYRDLTSHSFETVLEMISGRFGAVGSEGSKILDAERPTQAPDPTLHRSLAALQPRVSWDRVHNRLLALPGSQQLALVNGGTIPDMGQYAVYAPGGIRIGELDEEFVYERRIGDTFLLGTNAWRLNKIEADRVLVAPAEGALATVPFWHGEMVGRSYDLGLAVGQFLRQLGDRIDNADCQDWLEKDYSVDARSARNIRSFVQRQLAAAGCLPSDQTVCIEASRDQLGDWQVILLSPLGSRLHLALRLALECRLHQRLGYRPQCLHHDDGVLLRLADAKQPVLDLFNGITAENVESLILEELADTPLFALRFRQNAARALLMPRSKLGRRAPLWLQRLRGRDLLQVARQYSNFPIVVETFRECLHDHLDLPRLQALLVNIEAGTVRVEVRRTETPSPFAASLLFNFTAAFMYEYDRTDPDRGPARTVDQQLLDQLLGISQSHPVLHPHAAHQVDRRLRFLGHLPRTPTEMAEWLRRLGDITEAELEGPMAGFLQELKQDGRAKQIELPRSGIPLRWILAEEEATYEAAFGLKEASTEQQQTAAKVILNRFLGTHALVGLNDLLERYPFERRWARCQLEEWADCGRVVAIPPSTSTESMRWSAPENLEQIQRGSLSLLRGEVVTSSTPQFVDFILRWQMVHPATRQVGPEGLAPSLERLQGIPLPADLWERVLLPARLPGYQPRWLDEAADGAWSFLCQGVEGPGPGHLSFMRQDQQRRLAVPLSPDTRTLTRDEERILEYLRTRGASFVSDIAQDTGRAPDIVRAGLWRLLRRSLTTNDRFDVIRQGEQGIPLGREGQASRSNAYSLRLSRAHSLSRRPEGRWSLLAWSLPNTENQAIQHAWLLLNRYGVIARELALLDPWMTPWRILYEVLTRLELSGEVRRGYFVEGLSGGQFALPEAAEMLQSLHLPSTVAAPVLLLHSLDPANLFGSGAPFDIPLLDGGTRAMARRSGNWLALRAGRPVLLVEGQGKRLTALSSASMDDVAAAIGCLPQILSSDRTLAGRHKLMIEEWNGQPVTTTPGRELLEAVGFVRDYQGMILYGAWR